LDTVQQIQGHLFAQQYEGLIKKSNLRGGKRSKQRASRGSKGRKK